MENINDYIVLTQINLNKQPQANSDLALYMSYLTKGFYVDRNEVVRGMEPFKTKFEYKLSKEIDTDSEKEVNVPQVTSFSRHKQGPRH